MMIPKRVAVPQALYLPPCGSCAPAGYGGRCLPATMALIQNYGALASMSSLLEVGIYSMEIVQRQRCGDSTVRGSQLGCKLGSTSTTTQAQSIFFIIGTKCSQRLHSSHCAKLRRG